MDDTDVMDALDVVVRLAPLIEKKISTAALLAVDQSDLSGEFATQSARYAYFAVLCAEARKKRDDAEAALKQEEAEAFVYYKNSPDHIPNGSKYVTDGMANMLIVSDEDCVEAKAAYIEAERKFRIMEALVKSLDQRSNMLISLGAHLRSEADMTGMYISDDPGESIRRTLKSRKND